MTVFELLALLAAGGFVVCWPLLTAAAAVSTVRKDLARLRDEEELALGRVDDLAARVGDVELDDLALSMTATALEDTLAKMADLADRVRDLEVGER